MIRITLCLVASIIQGVSLFALPAQAQDKAPEKPYAIVIHGGAGTITRDRMTPELERDYRTKLGEALRAGQTILHDGGNGLDAVVAAIMIMEDSPLFNAGKGAVFTAEGRNELDAAVMNGRTLNAGSIAGVTRVKNPISLARAVMEQSRHVMMQGTGAEEFARTVDVELVSPLYFYTERRFKSLMRVRAQKEGRMLEEPANPWAQEVDDHKYGTVGAVVLDKNGDVYAGTSTGGLTNKLYGRVGDVPIIGAGTYANNAACAVSATGTGEFFIRATVAREVCALIEYKGMALQTAADEVIFNRMAGLGGDGGIIAVDMHGNMAYSFNTEGMYRARAGSNLAPEISIYKHDDESLLVP